MDSTMGFKFTFLFRLTRVNCALKLTSPYGEKKIHSNLTIMTLKIFRAIWFLSMLATLASLLYVYASLPPEVIVAEDGPETIVFGRDLLFYTAMIVIAMVNVLVYLFSQRVAPDEDFRVWLNGLVITANIFFIIAMSFISLYNSTEKFDFSQIGFIIYSSVGLVALWLLSWPVYQAVKKNISKQVV
jgi:hypothetical protein